MTIRRSALSSLASAVLPVAECAPNGLSVITTGDVGVPTDSGTASGPGTTFSVFVSGAAMPSQLTRSTFVTPPSLRSQSVQNNQVELPSFVQLVMQLEETVESPSIAVTTSSQLAFQSRAAVVLCADPFVKAVE